MTIIKLNQQFINNNLRCPEGKSRIAYYHSDLKSFYLEVRATSPGQGTFYYQYRDQSVKTRHQKLGRTTEITLSEALKQAKILKAEIALGRNPTKQVVMSYTEFFEQHYLPYVKLRKRSWNRDEELYRLRIRHVFGNKYLDQITRQQIQAFHTALKAAGLAASTCNHHVKLLKYSLNLAISWEMMEGPNPAAKVPLYHEDNKVAHYLNDAELERLLSVLHSDRNRIVCQIAFLLLSTGCRLNEVLSAKWSDIDLEQKIFLVRATNSKSKRIRAVPLNESAMEVLHQLDTREYLFINTQTGKPYTAIAKVWHRIRKKAGLEHLRLHDLRHQYASFLVNSGRTLYEVQQILGHSDSKVTERYSHLSMKILLEASDSASAKIKKAMQPK
ncbi:site-specific integrase [Nitrosomonas nitrosa]|uniref:site-specific integrase n=1 Tax=Nitrosomonas nitrosa TaxID=52442 RepID=UPI0023F7E700|nr:site-specific integrase [Nitrosomonas nitrosa]MCO6434177.1 tyrosine-type recombinase/integrase [Nitrosomonas nitrosa]